MAQLTIGDEDSTETEDNEARSNGEFRFKREISLPTAASVVYLVETIEGGNKGGVVDDEDARELAKMLGVLDGVTTTEREPDTGSQDEQNDETGSFVSTDHFANHLTSGQDALFRVLLDDVGEWVPSDVALERMENSCNHTPGSTRAIGGILAGMKKKYGENDLVKKKNITDRKAYWLNPNYEDELRDSLRRSEYSDDRPLP